MLLDWVQDASKEQFRRKVRRKEAVGFFASGGRAGWRYKLWESYEAAQGWIVVTLIGEFEHESRRSECLHLKRCGHWNECSFPQYYNRMAFGCEAWLLHNCLLSQ